LMLRVPNMEFSEGDVKSPPRLAQMGRAPDG
jgi:hypothetical protein